MVLLNPFDPNHQENGQKLTDISKYFHPNHKQNGQIFVFRFKIPSSSPRAKKHADLTQEFLWECWTHSIFQFLSFIGVSLGIQKSQKKCKNSHLRCLFPWGPYLFHGKWMKYDEIHWNPAKRRPESVKISTFPFLARPLVTWSFGPLVVPWSRTVWVSASKAKLDPSEFRASRRLHSEVAWEIPTSPTPNAGQIMDMVCQYYDTHMVMISKWKKHVNNCSHIIWNSFGIILWWYQ